MGSIESPISVRGNAAQTRKQQPVKKNIRQRRVEREVATELQEPEPNEVEAEQEDPDINPPPPTKGKRGRRRRAEAEDEGLEEPPPKRRVTRVTATGPEPVASDISGSQNTRSKKRGGGRPPNPAKESRGEDQVENEAVEEAIPPPSKERKTKKGAEPAARPEGEARRSMRDRRSALDFPMWLGSNESFTASTPRKIGPAAKEQPEKVTSPPPSIEQEPVRRRPGRPPAEKASAPAVPNAHVSAVAPTAAKKRRRSRAHDEISERREAEPGVDEPNEAAESPRSNAPAQRTGESRRGRPRRVQPQPDADAEIEQDEGDDSRETKFYKLKERVRNVPRAEVEAKWQPLDEVSIDLVNNILIDSFNPALNHLQVRPQRHQQAICVLDETTEKIAHRLRRRQPFPKPLSKLGTLSGTRSGTGHESELDYERLLKAIGAMNRQLATVLDSERLLTSTLKKEEAELEDEYRRRRELESNAKAEARSWKERSKKAHALAPSPRNPDGHVNSVLRSRLELQPSGPSLTGNLFKVRTRTFVSIRLHCSLELLLTAPAEIRREATQRYCPADSQPHVEYEGQSGPDRGSDRSNCDDPSRHPTGSGETSCLGGGRRSSGEYGSL